MELCEHQAVLRASLLTAVVLVAGTLVLCGILSQRSLFFYLGASALVSTAALLLIFRYWIRKKLWKKSKMEIGTVSGNLNYYSQVPPGKESDYPMGPNLILTLPPPDTPVYAKKRDRLKKNLPPLASMETLTPSLLSSSYSIDSVV